MRLSTRALKWLSIILPLGFWLLVLDLRAALFGENRSFAGDVFALFVLGVGALAFSLWVFGIVENREAEIRRRSAQLAALHTAGYWVFESATTRNALSGSAAAST